MRCHHPSPSIVLIGILNLATILFAPSHHAFRTTKNRHDLPLSARIAAPAPPSYYTFDAKSSSNLAVYFGRTDATSNTTLVAQCSDPNVDIVILAFVTAIFGGGGYPDVSFGKLCGGGSGSRTAAMRAAGATGLVSCLTDLAPQITQCQALGKKVLVGIGGQNGNVTFGSAQAAEKGAKLLWQVFGGGGDGLDDAGLRPFGGNVTVDGFDIDNETGNASYYSDFVHSLRSLYQEAQTSKKTYYLSAAPSCNYLQHHTDDSSLQEPTLAILNLFDWVWPQFYSAPSCNLGSDGFAASFSSWSSLLKGPRLYIGAAAFPAAVSASNGGYQDPDAFAATVATAKRLAKHNNFGGVMLWDGAYAHITRDALGRDYANVTKTALLLTWVRPGTETWEREPRLLTGA